MNKNLKKKFKEKYRSVLSSGKTVAYRILKPQEPWTPRKTIRWIIALSAAGFTAGVFIIFTSFMLLSIGLPDVDNIENIAKLSTEIYDRNGIPLYTLHGEENREYIPYEKISPYVIDAFVAMEDDQFWEHNGYDLPGIARAAANKFLFIGKQRGGSTITQQYAKNAFLTPERSVIRKIRELILAIKIEHRYEKPKIMELYLNQIPFGNNAYGVQKAAQVYFGKNAADLSIAESAILAALPQAPSYYNPYGNQSRSHLSKTFSEEELKKRTIKNESDLKDEEFVRGLLGSTEGISDGSNVYIAGRTDFVLQRLLKLGFITEEEKQDAWEETQVLKFNAYRESIRAPHFVLYVSDLLEKKYGKEVLEGGGLKVFTTLDWNLQKKAEEIIEERGAYNEKTYDAGNAAAMTVDPNTGQILAMVGSRDFFNDEIEGKNDMTRALRLPGSSFKPITYAQAFLNRYSPATVLYDVPTKIGPDKPENYDGEFHGPMSIRRALGQSRNIPAIKAYWLGNEQNAIIDLATKMGITTLDKKRDYGYPLAIGAGEVKMRDMVTAYSTLATGGIRPTLVPILKVENTEGEVLEEWKPESIKKYPEVLDPQVAYLISDILSDPSVRISNTLTIPGHIVAVKTGTSTNQSKSKGGVYPVDLWVIGYTPDLVTAVWAGNTKGTTARNANGADTSGPIWKRIMTAALEEIPNKPFKRPAGIQEVAVSAASGLLPGENTPKDKITTELFASFAIPTEVENIFFKKKIDTRNNLLANEYCPKNLVEERVFQNHQDPLDRADWATGIKNWYAGKNGAVVGLPPTEESPFCTKEFADNKPEIFIKTPTAYSPIAKSGATVKTEIQAKNGIDKVEYLFDGQPRFVITKPPFNKATIKPQKYTKPGKTYLLEVKITDTYGFTDSDIIEVKIENTETNTASDTNSETNNSTKSKGGVSSEKDKTPTEEIGTPLLIGE